MGISTIVPFPCPPDHHRRLLQICLDILLGIMEWNTDKCVKHDFPDIIGFCLEKRLCCRRGIAEGGMQDLYSGSLTALSPKPWAPHFATNLSLNGDWTMVEPPYVPPYGKWIRAPPPDSFMAAAMGMDRPAYDPKLPPVMMPRPGYVAGWSAPPPPYVFRSAAPPNFAPASQRRGPRTWFNEPSDHTWCNEPFDAICSHLYIEGPSGEAFNDSSVEPFGVGICKTPFLLHIANVSLFHSFLLLFHAVCVISGNNEVQKASGSEASCVEYDADKAIKFLQEEIKTDSAFTFDKTVMTSILAFQHLFLQEFEADEIRVFAWKKGYVVGKELQQEREDPDVEELLASLNGPDNDLDAV